MGLPTTHECIEDEERRIGRPLPEPIREVLLKNNGQVEVEANDDNWILYPVKDTSSRKHISRTANHIEKETTVARQWAGFPAEGVVIGENGTGDRLVLLPDEAEIFVWWHDTQETEACQDFEILSDL